MDEHRLSELLNQEFNLCAAESGLYSPRPGVGLSFSFFLKRQESSRLSSRLYIASTDIPRSSTTGQVNSV